jgi:hypothetical protein
MATYSAEKLIVAITNVGKETSLYYLINFVNKNSNIRLHILVIDDSNKQQVIDLLTPFPNNVQFGCIDNIDNLNSLTIGEYNEKYLFQLCYYENIELVTIIKNNLQNYDYFSLDLIFNEEEENFTNYLYENSNKKYVIKTKFKDNIVIPYFTMDISETFNPRIQYEIIKLGFKNTFGRKSPNSFTAHYVGHNGPTYENTKKLYETMNAKIFEEKVGITGESHDEAIKYFEHVNKNNIDEDFRQKQFNIFRQNNQIQIIGLARIIEGLNQMFGFPKKVILENDKLFEDIQKNFMNSWRNYLLFLNSNPLLPLTPCYDLISAIALTKYIDKDYDNYFDENNIFKYINDYTLFKNLIIEFN